MKTLSIYLACFAAVAVLSSSAGAATLQWSYTLGAGNFCIQTIADGYGGVAVVTLETGTYRVAWFDKKGAVRYNKSGLVGALPILLACEKNALVFCYLNGPTYQIITVDAKGNASTTSAANTHYISYVGIIGNTKVLRLNDRKGYFVERLDIPTNVITLERYSYK